jgi:hypothetical protein
MFTFRSDILVRAVARLGLLLCRVRFVFAWLLAACPAWFSGMLPLVDVRCPDAAGGGVVPGCGLSHGG